MGMYTQVRGILCCNSIGQHANKDVQVTLDELQKKFKQRNNIDRPWVCEFTKLVSGGNSSEFLIITLEFKNYCNSIDEWIKYLVKNIMCEGRIEFQYEECEKGDLGKVLLVKNSVIAEESYRVHTFGYGFDGEDEPEEKIGSHKNDINEENKL